MKLNNDVAYLKSKISKKVNKAATPRQIHFDNIAREMGYADSNIAFNILGKYFLDVAKKSAPSINF